MLNILGCLSRSGILNVLWVQCRQVQHMCKYPVLPPPPPAHTPPDVQRQAPQLVELVGFLPDKGPRLSQGNFATFSPNRGDGRCEPFWRVNSLCVGAVFRGWKHAVCVFVPEVSFAVLKRCFAQQTGTHLKFAF